MMIGAYAGFIRKEYHRVFSLGASGYLWILFLAPSLDQLRVLLPRPVQRPLGGEAQTLHQTSYGHFAQARVELLEDQLANHRQSP